MVSSAIFRMTRLLLFTFLILGLVAGFSQPRLVKTKSLLDKYLAADRLYHQAELLSAQADYTDETAEKEAALNRQALAGFYNLLTGIEKAGYDSLAFHCYLKIGILEHYFDSLTAARLSYAKAISLKEKLVSTPDSFFFKPHIYLGGILYNLNKFDSALFHFKNAEAIANKYATSLDGINRLYNTLGAMYFETGNYKQAKNYFEKAIALLGKPARNSTNEALLINYLINLAGTLTRLEEYDAANEIYQQLLKQDINKNEILHNVGAINLRLGAGQKALDLFRQVKYGNNRQVRLLNDIGQAFENIGQFDSARHYYQLAAAENKKWNGRTRNIQAGLTWKYLAELDLRYNAPDKALDKYQQAMIQFASDFKTEDIYSNPRQFSGVFSYINLFYTLTGKARAFEKWYDRNKLLKNLEASLDAYRIAYVLADYVEKTYDSDEARLFLNKIKYATHHSPIAVSFQLYKLTGKKKFLEELYTFDQRNKASLLSLAIYESELKNVSHGDQKLFERETTLKTSITRLSLKAAQTADSLQMLAILNSIRDQEILLGKVQEEIKKDVSYTGNQFTDRVPPVASIQEKLEHGSAVVSFHLSEESVVTTVITKDRLEVTQTSIPVGFFSVIDSLKKSLHDLSPGINYSGGDASVRLHRWLFDPIQEYLTGVKRLIIIPDDELNYLPIEALRDKAGRYIIERYSIQYLYATPLFKVSAMGTNISNVLAFAPFASIGQYDSTNTAMPALPGSGDEVMHLRGKVFIGREAKKARFIQTANQHSVIHLATHASVNNEQPQRSFIAFYPGPDDKLYASEIYDMALDSTQLVILSACETGSGQLIKGEGLMSLSRAFAYAGCPNIITSIWKAEDQTTAFITQRLYYYLGKGWRKDKALQQAKLDLLQSPDIDPRFKTPNYWAHLVFIGQYETTNSSRPWQAITVAGIVILLLLFILYQRIFRRRFKSKPS